MPRKALRLIVITCINTILKGTRFYRLKRAMMTVAGYKVGDKSKIVGPLTMSPTSVLEIGDGCWIGTSLVLRGNGAVIIGNNCDIAPDVTFLTGTHDVGSSARRAGKGRNTKITIDDGCWVGARSTIVGDVHVGSASIIGAGSLIVHDVNPNSLTAGVPAKKLRDL